VKVRLPLVDGVVRAACWGPQVDVRVINRGETSGEGKGETQERAARVAGYLAKYATKTVADTVTGLPKARGRSESVMPADGDRVPGHVRALVETARRLARHPACRRLRLGRRVDALGFGGHVTSKSRRYSLTFALLRGARRAWRITEQLGRQSDPWAGEKGTGEGTAWVVVGEWRMLGLGYATFGDAALALSLGAQDREARAAARLGLLEEPAYLARR
jgi:hypothetical protein